MEFLRAQLTKIPRITPVDLASSTVLITGANSGLGLESAREILHSKPNRLILAVRDLEKGHAAARELQQSKPPSTTLDVRKLDQASFDSVRKFVKDLEGEPIYVAILNAGVWNTKFASTKDGYENELQVNVLAPALLSILLLPNLRLAQSSSKSTNSTPAHLTFVGSGLHEMAKFPEKSLPQGEVIAALNDSTRYDPQDRYPTTKVVNMLWTKELSNRVDKSQIVINSPNPGFCKTDLMRNNSGIMGLLVKIFTALIARSAADGARCIVDAAVIKGPETHGKYLSEVEIKPESSLVREAAAGGLQGKIWEEITSILKSQTPSQLEASGVV